MKYCERCNKDLDTKERLCPVCGAKLSDITREEAEAAETVSTMTITGIL